MASDLHIDTISDSLAGKTVDVVVSGSIGSVESVRFIRSLRRLGAVVRPILTSGGRQFVTETALSWAAAGPVVTQFTGESSHISQADACVVAPASANIISAIAQGRTDSPGAAAIASLLGAGRPVILIPNMHDSLYKSPAVRENLARLAQWTTVLDARLEEGKHKFPDPATLADEVSHTINRDQKSRDRVLVTMGSTLGFIDAVRYVSNYSSGKLGSLISEELYRQGRSTAVVAGPCKYLPRVFSKLLRTATNVDMIDAVDLCVGEGISSAVMAASVLDYVPAKQFQGKLRSSESRLNIEMTPTPKIISRVQPRSKIKVGFKLEFAITEKSVAEIADKYFTNYDLSMLVVNVLGDVSEDSHKAVVIERRMKDDPDCVSTVIDGKAALAKHIARHVIELEQCR